MKNTLFTLMLSFVVSSLLHAGTDHDTTANPLPNANIPRAWLLKSISCSDQDSALQYFSLIFDIVSKIDTSLETKANLFEEMAGFYESNHQYEKALIAYQEALNLYEKKNDQRDIARTLNAIANIHYNRSNFDKALRHYQKALRIFETLGDSLSIAKSLGNIGNIFFLTGELDKALDHYKKVLGIFSHTADSIGMAKSYMNIANVLSSKSKYNQALAYYQKALEIQQQIKDSAGIALTYVNMGTIFESKNEPEKALYYYRKALSFNQRINEKQDMAYIYLAIANLMYKKGKFRECIENARKGLELAIETENIQVQKTALDLLADAYAAQKQYRKALELRNRAIALSDSIFNINKTRTIADIKVKYETEKLEKKILEQQNKLRINELMIAQEKAKNEKQIFQRKLLILGLLISLIFLFIIFYSKRQIQRTNAKLITTNQELADSLEVIKKQSLIIQEKEELFSITFNSANDAIILVDSNEKIILWNKTAEMMFGYTKEEAINQNVHDLVTPEKYKSKASAAFDLLNKSGKKECTNKTVEMEGKTKDGKLFPIELSLSAVKIKNELNVLGIVRDISKRKEDELKLKEVNKQKEILINNIPSGIFYKDIHLRYLEINKSFAMMLGKPAEEIIGKTDRELVSPDLYREYEKTDMQVIQNGKPLLDLVKEHIEGEKRYWISTSKIPYIDTNNTIAGIIGIVRDITKHVENEKAIEESKNKIEEMYRNISDNISYAKHIQNSLLPDKKILDQLLPEYFLFFKPKEMIGGDFYYVNKIQNQLIFAVADCTGHGVSGAMLSILGITFLHEIVNETLNPGEILNLLRTKIKNIFRTFGSSNKNGMDIALCVLDTETYTLRYSGAFNPLLIVRDHEVLEFKPTRNPVGNYYQEKDFQVTTIEIKKNDNLYIFSDGFADQFGGLKGKKFKMKNLKSLFLVIADKPMEEQYKFVSRTFDQWKGNREQIDDIVILGIKFT